MLCSRAFAVLVSASSVIAADGFYIRLHGLVTEYFTGDPMKGVQIRLVKDSVERETVFSNWKGQYEVVLDRGYDYQVWFYRKDLVPKYVRIDARDVPLFPDVPFYDMDVQMTMIAYINGFDFELFDMPVGMASYKHSVRNLSWDIEYTERMRAETARLMALYERAVGDLERMHRAERAANRRKKRKRAYF
ncbi:MAG: hypothetical protein ACK4L7_00775 [Flavobacteriales bacterium]